MSKQKRIRNIEYKRLPIPRPSGDGLLTSGLRRQAPTNAIGFTHSFASHELIEQANAIKRRVDLLMSNNNHDDKPYGISPAMQALPAIKAFNALPIGSEERRVAVRLFHALYAAEDEWQTVLSQMNSSSPRTS